MDKKELWQKVRVGFEKGYVVTKDVAIKSAKTVAAYAKESRELSKHKVNEMKVSRQLAKEFATLGHRVYELAEKKGDGKNLLNDSVIKKSLAKTKQLDSDLHKAQDKVKAEMKKMKEMSKSKGKTSAKKKI